jgi:protein SCO1/2
MAASSPNQGEGRGPRDRDGTLLRSLVWAAFGLVLLGVTAAGILFMARGPAAPGPPSAAAAPALDVLGEYGDVPDFRLTSATGRPVGLSDLRGRIWIADFIFTRCTGMCPILTGRMASIRKSLASEQDVSLVSFTVDPDYDSTEVLKRYAGEHAPGDDGWIFLTGDRQALYRLIGEGFKLSVAAAPPETASPGELITHSDRFVLVDRKGKIRGYFHGTDEEEMGRLLEAVGRLRAEG